MTVNSSIHKLLATPRAKHRARKEGIDLSTVQGTGLDGRILEQDVTRFLGSNQPVGAKASPMRRSIAQMTAKSFSTIPHFYLDAEIDATALVDSLQNLNPPIATTRVTLTDFLLRAQARALADCPFMNVLWEGESVKTLERIAVGLVVSVPDGILMPVIDSPHTRDLPDLASLRHTLVTKCRQGYFPGENCVGGAKAPTSATSLSNLGRGRVDSFFPVIHIRQSSMLAVGRLAPRPWANDGQVVVRHTLKLTLAVDHRVIDGTPGAAYLEKVCEYLEKPESH